MDTTHLTQKTNAAAPDRLSLGRPHLPWCGRPCCRPWQDAPPDVRPSGQPAAAFHPSFGCSPPLLPSFLSSPLSSNPPGPLTLLPDNPPNLPARRATHVSLTFRSSDSPNLPTANSNRRPQACVRRMQRRRLHNRTSSRVCKRSWAAERRTWSSVWAGSTAASNLQPTTNQPLTDLYHLAAH